MRVYGTFPGRMVLNFTINRQLCAHDAETSSLRDVAQTMSVFSLGFSRWRHSVGADECRRYSTPREKRSWLAQTTITASSDSSRARRSSRLETNLRCHNMEPHATCQSAASPLRLLDKKSDSRGADTVRLNASRRASCEGAREPLQPSCELEKICTQQVHGPPLAAFEKGAERVPAFFPTSSFSTGRSDFKIGFNATEKRLLS